MRAKLTAVMIIGMIVAFWGAATVGSYLTAQKQLVQWQELALEQYRIGGDADTIAAMEEGIRRNTRSGGILQSWQFALIVSAVGLQVAFWAKGKLAALHGGRRKEDRLESTL